MGGEGHRSPPLIRCVIPALGLPIRLVEEALARLEGRNVVCPDRQKGWQRPVLRLELRR
jgi:hypothetical protein